MQKRTCVSSLKFEEYVVESINLHINKEFQADGQAIPIDLEVGRQLEYRDNNGCTEITTSVRLNVFQNAQENNYPYELELVVVGIFSTLEKEQEQIKKFAELNTLTIMFPYLRALVSTITANANITPLILPPINVTNLVEKNE